VKGGRYSTDSSLVYELIELAKQFDEFFLHCFVIEGEHARDELSLPSGLMLVDLGRVMGGLDLYGHPLRLWRRVIGSAQRGDWSYAVLAEPGLTSLAALIACGLVGRSAVALVRGDPAVGGIAYRHRGLRAGLGWSLQRFRVLMQWVFAFTVAIITDSDVVADRLSARGAEVHCVAAASISEDQVLPPGNGWAGVGPLRLVFVGRLERVKDIETLLEAVRGASMTGRNLTLRIVGSGDAAYTALLHRRVQELALQEIVDFVGAVEHGSDLYRNYQNSHVLVLSSRSEGMPKVVIEAMAHGLPVVGTTVGGLPRLVSRRVGILVEPGDPEALSAALVTLHDSPTLARSMSAAARTEAKSWLAGPVSREFAAMVATASRRPHLRIGIERPREEGLGNVGASAARED